MLIFQPIKPPLTFGWVVFILVLLWIVLGVVAAIVLHNT